MIYKVKVLLCILPLIFATCSGLFEGDDCVMLNLNLGGGKCKELNKCEYAKQLLRSRKGNPEICGFKKQVPLVCCPTSAKLLQSVSISEEKCRQYHYARLSRTNIAGGLKAKSREFPHMSALGYGSNKSNVAWLCGGSLISERFVLTAAHCTNNAVGEPKWVRLGALNLNQTQGNAELQDIQVLKIFVHPDYKSQAHYHDIALLKLQTSAKFGSYVKPACIHTKNDLPSDRLQVIGWGTTGFMEDSSDHLMQATLNVIDHKKCSEMYATVTGRKLPNGISEEFQICAGDSSGKDTCPGDSGGPLQFLQTRSGMILNHFVIVGVTSFGKVCGFENSSGVYTRVAPYTSWIESIVWTQA